MPEADNGGTTPPAGQPGNGGAPAGDPPADTAGLGDGGRNAIAAERKARRDAERETAALKARLTELEQRDMTELQKQQARADAAEKAAAESAAAVLRFKVAAEKQVPAELLEFLTAGTEKDLAAQADKLLSLGTGTPAFDGGARGGGAAKPTDMNALIRRQAGLG